MVGKKRWKVVESFLYFGGREWLHESERSNIANQPKSARACGSITCSQLTSSMNKAVKSNPANVIPVVTRQGNK